MTAHTAMPALDDSVTRGKTLRPSSASPKTIGILRDEIGYEGIIITDAVGMKGIAAAFEHDDIYIECLKAGNDIVLFTGNDYIDVIEKAVAEGRISEEYIDSCVERILLYKEKLGLFDGKAVGEPMTDEDKADFARVNYEISKKGGTLINNEGLILIIRIKILKTSFLLLITSAYW
jgi:beta-N-acetylhexosaminidase